jgi:hypothetical protein
MSRVTLAMTESTYEEIIESLKDDSETAFTLSIGIADDEGGDLTVFVRQLDLVPTASYIERSPEHLLISSTGFMPAFGRVAITESSAGFMHTHPGGVAKHSRLDEFVDRELSPVAQLRTGKPYFLSVVVAGLPRMPRFAGRIFVGQQIRRIDEVRVVGTRIRLIRTDDSGESSIRDLGQFDRQIRAFGKLGQQTLGGLRVGVAGAGGTGSAVCEQLVRLGVGEIIVVDDDFVTESNVSRIYGSKIQDVGKLKVDVIAANAWSINGKSVVTSIAGRVTEEGVARKLRHCDVIFGCTDDQWGRSILARLSYWYLIPLFDMGVIITRDGDAVGEVIARITAVGPGTSCLLCRGRIQPAEIRAESLPIEERERLATEGYISGLGEPDPSVVTFTTLVAAFATSEMLKRLFGFSQGMASDETLIRIDRSEVRRNRVRPKSGHYCSDPTQWGIADTEPFLGQLWI